ncbi:hypothetical protein P154DRAFT_575986 [Amniculicola lignicola CBS 123094]|uniref:PTR2-domain-containing protein n=1 Tax=Amniculicola lignicola CBS 123094 TaxID=1392246 RepID=A0A6A5WFA6_9PLEO|nr:hypothetical protein P154DRAFT_575986 [Amniculicola lignicola CBS 123094]
MAIAQKTKKEAILCEENPIYEDGSPLSSLETKETKDTAGGILDISSDSSRSGHGLADEDLSKLRRVPGNIPWSAAKIACLEVFERFSFNGTMVVFTNYIQQPLPAGSPSGAGHAAGQSGALGMGQRASTGFQLFNSFWFCTTPLLGAIIADQYLGRYMTLQCSNIFALIGHIFLIMAAIPNVIAHPPIAMTLFVIGLLFLGLGFGGFKPNISPLLGEQVPDSEPRIINNKRGEPVIVDPEATRQRLFIYFFCFIHIGSAAGQASMTFAEKYVGFWLAFLVPTVVFFACPIILFNGHKNYTKTPPSRAVTRQVYGLLKLAMTGRWSLNPVRLYRNTQDPNFWSRVTPSNVVNKPSWMVYDDTWLEQFRRGIRTCKVFCWYPLYWISLRQMHSCLTSQAATMRLGNMPNDLVANINTAAALVLAPLYTHFIYRWIEWTGFRFTPIKRVIAGFASSAIAMSIAAIIQHFVYATSPCGNHANGCIHSPHKAPLSVWIQTPVYVLCANSEILAVVTAIALVYENAPPQYEIVDHVALPLYGKHWSGDRAGIATVGR